MKVKSLYSNLKTFYNLKARELHFLNPRFILVQNTLTWDKHISNEKFITYPEYYNWVVNNSQYSLMFEDESYIQIYFESDGEDENVKKGSMAYLPEPEQYSEYFRFDLDMNNITPYNHTAYHIHFGYRSKDVRFCLYQFPFPSEFIKFILTSVYEYEVSCFNPQKLFSNLDELNNQYNHHLSFSLAR
ncbi:MAG: hypothetical protein KAX49_19740 [Halanaerobiales bacterium]|nr:hypothetical protein [Halanaerobiales bacterium]